MAKKQSVDQARIDFYIQQIETTKKIVNAYGRVTQYSPTLLLNSLLSLIIIPCEDAKRKDGTKIFPGKYPELMKKLGIAPKVFQPIGSYKKGKGIKWGNKTIYAFIRKLRNGIAHQNIKLSVDTNKVVSVVIQNRFVNRECIQNAKNEYEAKGLKEEYGAIVDFEIELTIGQLEKTALYIADAYLKAIKEKGVI